MSNLSILQKEVLSSIFKKAITIDSQGSLSVAGIELRGIDGARTVELFLEGVQRDTKEFTPAGAFGIYRNICKNPDRLRSALEAPRKLSRMVDADIIAGR